MNIAELFEEIAKVKSKNDKYKGIKHKKEDMVEMYKKMMMSNYEISQNGLLNVYGRVDIFYDEREVKDTKLNKENYSYLVYDMTGHNGEWQIIEFDNLKDVEEYILSPGGILNMFTEEIIVLENLKNKRYKVCEILENKEEVEVFDFEDCTPDIEPNLIVKWI